MMKKRHRRGGKKFERMKKRKIMIGRKMERRKRYR